MLAGCRGDADGGPGVATGGGGERRFVETQWVRTPAVTGTAEDTLLRTPTQPVAVPGGFVVADAHTGSVARFGLDGTRRWRTPEFARGGVISDIAAAGDGTLWALDRARGSIAVLDSTGRALFRVPTSAAGEQPQALVPLAGGDVILLLPQTDAPFVRLNREGTVATRTTLPWKKYNSLSYLAGQLALGKDARSDRWVAAFSSGDGFFIFREDDPATSRLRFIEPVNFPRIVTEKRGNTTITRPEHKPRLSALSVTLSPTRIYVLFGGSTRLRNRIVDSYSLQDGRYLESHLLPARTSSITWAEGGLLTVSHRPYASIEYLKPAGTALP